MRTLLQSFSNTNSRTLRYVLGFTVVLSGSTLLLMQAAAATLVIEPQLWRALQGGMLCALGTALGALPVLFMRGISVRMTDTLLGFGGGVMLAATVFSLLIPALDAAGDLGFTKWGAGFLASLGVLIGASALFGLGRLLPQPNLEVREDGRQPIPPRILLFVIAVVLHNIPEGMAVGVSAGAGLPGADSLAMGIALQDLPEGLIISLVLAGAGMGRGKALLIGAASGLVEPVFAVLCAWLVGVSALLLPWGLALAAGAMLFAVTHEIIPESHRKGFEAEASMGLAAGFCLMMVMDTALA
ncbi:ZIP family metal transporter [Pseudomonas sp. PDM14]|uniref:ZIP family metal transporter n=1 Tax=Pseudomonas sp. PDM14 TaxID=2769288 RepID=UPI001786EF94|nr:ZIP family metal transporter [Pseudomonas sp. PDM14]MBD9485473.1 ZIP family metal transporter [Pseudomonas sp. PDM14]